MTPPDESGTYQRVTTPPAVIPTDTVNTAATVPAPRRTMAEEYVLAKSAAYTAKLAYHAARDRADALLDGMSDADAEVAIAAYTAVVLARAAAKAGD